MASYGPEAIADAFQFYLKYNGQNHARIEKEMRKTWPGWSKQNLYTRGRRPNQKFGWIDKYGWEKALKLHLAAAPEGVLNSAEELVREIEQMRKRIFSQLRVQGAKIEKDLVYQHRDYCKLSIDALTKVEAARDTLGGFVTFWERLMEWLPAMSKPALKELLKVADKVIEKATAEYANDTDEASAVSGRKG